MVTPWAVWLVAKLPGCGYQKTWEHSRFPPLPFLFSPFSFSLSGCLFLFFSFYSTFSLVFFLSPLFLFSLLLYSFYFSLFFPVSLLFIKKTQISLSLLPYFFPLVPPTPPIFYYSLCLLPPRLPSPPGPQLSFAHGEITADKRAPPCPTVLHEALWNLVLGSLASPPSLLGGVP